MNTKAAAADQKALAAGQTADQANQNATQASNRVTSLAGTVENLDNYQSVADTTVLFAFDKADLTRKDKQTLDDFASQLQNQRHYIIQVEGYTDSTGPADYNYQLSQRRADAVIQYLAQKYNVPAHKIFLIGLGKDNPVAQNTQRVRPRQEPPRRCSLDGEQPDRVGAIQLSQPATVRATAITQSAAAPGGRAQFTQAPLSPEPMAAGPLEKRPSSNGRPLCLEHPKFHAGIYDRYNPSWLRDCNV